MKWILLIGITLLASACISEVVEYRQVSVAPAIEPVVIDGGYPGANFMAYPRISGYPGVVDVTHTAIDFF